MAVGVGETVTTGLHIGFSAASPAAVDAFWQAGVDAGHPSDGEPGRRPQYGEDYYGGFLLDPDGNSIEAVHHDTRRPDGFVDHVWIRVADLEASRAFHELVGRFAGFRVESVRGELVQFKGDGPGSYSILRDERPVTGRFHVAFPAPEATVRDWHAAAVGAGYRDHGAPGERPEYHPGYYGAFVLDPDGHNVELVDHHRG
jgi:predicted lactoylglutathione lyase